MNINAFLSLLRLINSIEKALSKKSPFIQQKVTTLTCLTLLLNACGKEPLTQNVDVNTYRTYQNNGLTMRHPPHWVIKFDEAPDFSNDRAVVFELSEVSGATLFIYKDKKFALATIANDYVNRLQLTKKPSIQDYERTPIKISGNHGVRLSWKETEIFERGVEITILELKGAPSQMFVVFNLDEEDLEKESPVMAPVVASIQYQTPP